MLLIPFHISGDSVLFWIL